MGKKKEIKKLKRQVKELQAQLCTCPSDDDQKIPHTRSGMWKDSKYYEDLIEDVQKVSGNAMDRFIAEWTRKDPAFVLAAIGLNHPASPTVLRYLAKMKNEEKIAGKLGMMSSPLCRAITDGVIGNMRHP